MPERGQRQYNHLVLLIWNRNHVLQNNGDGWVLRDAMKWTKGGKRRDGGLMGMRRELRIYSGKHSENPK